MSLRIRALLAAAAAALTAAVTGAIPAHAIINGSVVSSPDTYPYAVRLSYQMPDGTHICSGALVATTWVMTAGHCVPARPSTATSVPVTLRIGSNRSDTGGEVRTADAWAVYPGYNGRYNSSGTDSGDVALFHLDLPSTKRPIALPTVPARALSLPDYTFKQQTAIGYGDIDFDKTLSAELRSVGLGQSDLVTTIDRQYRIGTLLNNAGPYEGDSGSPLVIRTSAGDTTLGVFSTYDASSILTNPNGGRRRLIAVHYSSLANRTVNAWARSTLATNPSPQHALKLTDAIAVRPVATPGETFRTIDFIADEGPTSRTTFLTGDPSYAPFYVDDIVDIRVTQPDGTVRQLSHDFSSTCDGTGLTPISMLDFSSLLTTGLNRVRVTLRDECGFDVSSSAIWVIGQGAYSLGQ